MRTMDEWDPTCGWSTDEVEWYLMGPFDGGVPGLVPRVRRILECTADSGTWRRASRARKDARVRYFVSPYLRWRDRGVFGTPADHPAPHQLVAEVVHLDEVRESRLQRVLAAC